VAVTCLEVIEGNLDEQLDVSLAWLSHSQQEGWQPSTFRSSRSDRAQAKQQSIDDYLDEDERRERGRSTLQVKPEYDTFGAGAAELARSIAQREADARPSLIPGAIFNELTIPVSASIGRHEAAGVPCRNTAVV
jgi:G patch domain-containing protein 1